jgi:uncharacterized membrane protein
MPLWLEDFIGFLWLVIFPEAFINGLLVTALVWCPIRLAGNLQPHALSSRTLEG